MNSFIYKKNISCYLLFFLIKLNFTMISTHFKCRRGIYPRSTIERFSVGDDKVNWSILFKDYKPIEYNSPTIKGKPWADLDVDDPNFQPKWNTIDGDIDRTSYIGKYEIVNGRPQNPIGRTGIIGRGVLGRWGPNHAADPVVTRWKRINGLVQKDYNNIPILQFVAIKRGDTGEWALPGGMVDPSEKVSVTAIREFQEEAMNSLLMTDDQKQKLNEKLKTFFNAGVIVYQGYVDDWRNTDNAWMETVAYNFHDETGDTVGNIALHAGDDAVGVQWVDATPNITLYASHEEILKEVLKRHIQADTNL